MRVPRLRVTLLAALVCACDPDGRQGAEDGTDLGDEVQDADAAVDAGSGFIDAAGQADGPDGGTDRPDGVEAVVYAHTASTLYRVDADTLAVTLVGAFGWPAGSGFEQMTDIAVTSDERVFGVSFGNLYEVDPLTAVCTHVAPLGDTTFNALTFIQGASGERLVGAAGDGRLFEIDQATGAPTPLGSYGAGTSSSGDLVSIRGEGTFATVVKNGVEYLARIDETTGAATPIGLPTGVSGIWGLGYWKGKVFGFSSLAGFVLIDLASGVAVPAPAPGSLPWWGAGVTTRAVIID